MTRLTPQASMWVHITHGGAGPGSDRAADRMERRREMCERGVRSWAALALLPLAAIFGAGCGKGQEELPACEFNSRLAFEVWVYVEADKVPRSVGTMPAEKPLAIPPGRRWWVEPLDGADMAAVMEEVKAKGIPGLQLPPGGSDADLAHLKELKGLQALNLWGTAVTDASLAHLKD